MHHQRSPRVVRNLNLGAYHFMFNILLAIGSVGYFIYSAVMYDQRGMMMSGGGAAVWLFSAMIFFLKRASMKCSLCMSPVWGARKCQKHSKVKPALGISYRLGIATSIIFKGYYRCPYCGEPFSARKSRKPGESSRRR